MLIRKIIEYAYNSWETHELLQRWRKWPWRNTALLGLSLIVFLLVMVSGLAHRLFEVFQELSYIGVFIAGMLFPSTFTVAPAIALLFGFADDLNPYTTAAIAGAGAMLGDYIIFRFLKDKVFDELRPLFQHFKNDKLTALFRTPYFAWLIPIAGMLMIASPLPDEVGLGMISTSPIRRWQFLVLAFLLNTVGILLVILGARLI